MNKGRVFIVSGPSGVGKSTVLRAVMEGRPNLRFSVSATTRKPRPGEQEGISYFFVSMEKFESLIGENALAEYNIYGDNYYGTPVRPVEDARERGVDIILDVEPHGAMNVRKQWPDAVMIFISPPSLGTLKRRLESRGDTAPEDIAKRLKQARWECEQACKYDYLVVNDDLATCIGEVEAILRSDDCRFSRRSDFMNELLKEEI